MLIFNEGRKPFLDFLRNLTPQALLLSSALLLYVRLDFRRIDLSNIANTLAFFAAAGFALIAAFASATIYLEETFRSLKRYARVLKLVARHEKRLVRVIFITSKVMWRHNKSVFFEMGLSLILLDVSSIIVISAAVTAARAALR